MKTLIISLALTVSLSFAWAAETMVNDCDSGISFSVSNGAAVADVAGQVNGAKRITMPALTRTDGIPEARSDVSGTDWSGTEGIRFWVRGDGAVTGGQIQLLWSRFYASFPITATWTEVTVPWREFTQRLYNGPIESNLGSIDQVCFTVNPNESHDATARPGHWYEVDEIRTVTGLSLSTTPQPSSPGLPHMQARIDNNQPVNIIVLGDSVSYGHINGGGRVATPWPAAMETKLRADLAKSDIYVHNYGIRGCKTWQAASNVNDFVYPQDPDVVFIQFLGNDHTDAESGNGVDEYRDNMERLMDTLLRWDSADIVLVLQPPYGEAGNTHVYDTYIAEVTAAANARNLVIADVYNPFLAMNESTMLSYYQSGDKGHLTNAGLDIMAGIISDDVTPLVSAGGSAAISLTVPASATEGDGVLGAQGTVTLSQAASGNQIVDLSSNNAIVSVPATVTVLDGQTAVNFNITVNDDGVYGGTVSVTITASASGWTSGTDSISIADDDIPVTVSLPASVQEGDGLLADAGMVSIPAPAGSNLTVNLSSDDTGELQVPISVTILSGSSSALFDLTVIDDAVTDSNVIVAVTASAAGYADGTDTVTVYDIDFVIPDNSGGGTKGGCTPSVDSFPLVLVLVLVLGLARRDLKGLQVNKSNDVAGH